MTFNGKVKSCAKNVLEHLKGNNREQAYYWTTVLHSHLTGEEGKLVVLRPEVKRLVDRVFARYPTPFVPLPRPADPPIVIKPKTYTLDEAGIARVTEIIVELVRQRAFASGYVSMSETAEAVRQAIPHHIKKVAICN